jgi:hypothetical protein
MRRGKWLETTRPWHDTNVSYCDVCGRLIPRRSWVFSDGAKTLSACSPDCEDLYDSYLKPALRRGEDK